MELISNLFVPLFYLLLFVGQIWTTQEPGSEQAQGAQDCSFDGQQFKSGDIWIHHEDCTHCSCRNGLSFCKPVECDYPKGCKRVIKPHPQTSANTSSLSCCPVCADCLSRAGRSYAEGDVWEDDSCTSCICSEGRKKCHTISCKSNCLTPRFIPGQCCPVCDERTDGDDASSWSCPSTRNCVHLDCEHGAKLDSRGCPSCECNKCSSLANCTKNCPSGFSFNEDGCAVCKCIDNGDANRYHRCTGLQSSNDEWFDGCRQCICRHGVEMCTVLSCPAAKCEHPTIYPEECCPRCSDETRSNAKADVLSCSSLAAVDGRVHSEAEFWSAGPCLNCTCHNGQILCASPTCPPPSPAQCHAQTLVKDGECCATCPENKQHEITRNPSSADFNCFADDTRTIYQDGEMWKVGDCQTCTCIGGQMDCYSTQKCANGQATCENPVFLKFQCCPTCLDFVTYDLPTDGSHSSLNDSCSSNQRRIFLEPHCIILTATLMVLALAVGIYIIRYRLRRKDQRRRVLKTSVVARSPQGVLLSPPTPPVTPNYGCCYKYYSSRGHLSEQKTPLCSSTPNASSQNKHEVPFMDGRESATSTLVEKV